MRQKLRWKPWFYCVPALLLIFIVIVFPIAYTGYISLTNMNLYHWTDYGFIGLGNYARALFKFDSGFLAALGTTLVWTVLNMAIQIGLGFFIALGLNAPGLRLKRVYKTLLMVPWAVPAYISILLWRVGMFNTEFGILNKFLAMLGLGKVDFLASNGIAFLSCMALNLWMALPFMISTIDGALQSVDGSLYESATLDGAGKGKQFFSITLPLLKGVIKTSITFWSINTTTFFLWTKMFSPIDTEQSTIVPVVYLYDMVFGGKGVVTRDAGAGAAVGVVLTLIIIAVYLITNRLFRGTDLEY